MFPFPFDKVLFKVNYLLEFLSYSTKNEMEEMCPGAFWILLPMSSPRTGCSCQLSIFLTDGKETKPRLEIQLTLALCSFAGAPLAITCKNLFYISVLCSICKRKYLACSLNSDECRMEHSILSACRRQASNASKHQKTRCSVVTITGSLMLCSDYSSDQMPTEN